MARIGKWLKEEMYSDNQPLSIRIKKTDTHPHEYIFFKNNSWKISEIYILNTNLMKTEIFSNLTLILWETMYTTQHESL